VDQTFYKLEQPATDKGSLQIDLTHVPDGRYRVATYRVGYKHNDAYTAYVEMNSPNQLTKAQVDALNAVSTGAPESDTEVRVKDGHFTRSMPLLTNDIYLVVMTPLKGR